MPEKSKVNVSTIVIKDEIRERLTKVGYKGQTYNEIIVKLLDSRSNRMDSLDNGVESLKSSESSNS